MKRSLGLVATLLVGAAAHVLLLLEGGATATMMGSENIPYQRPSFDVKPENTISIKSDENEDVEYEEVEDGKRIHADVFGNQTAAYYRFEIGKAGFDHIEIFLDSIHGDGDLYVLVSDEKNPSKPPGARHADYASRVSSGRDYVIMREADPPVKRSCNANNDCYALIAVAPFNHIDVLYSMVVRKKYTPVELSGGHPHMDHVMANTYDYFWYNLTSVLEGKTILKIDLTPFSGDPDLYVSLVDDVSNTTGFPDKQNHDWASRHTDRDIIHISSTDVPKCSSAPCYYGIAVYASQNLNASFALVATESDAITYLIDGETQVGTVGPNDVQLYKFTAPAHSGNVRISVDPWIGDPDLFVNAGKDLPHPGPGGVNNYTSRNSNGEDVVMIDTSSAAYQRACGSGPCVIQAAVTSRDGAGYFITATANRYRRLQEGVSVEGEVQGGFDQDHFVYFYFKNTEHDATLLFSLTALSGDPDLFISAGNGSDASLPTYTSAQWRSLRLGSDVIEIKTQVDSHSCLNQGIEDCSYWVGVASGFSAASFSLVVSTEHENSTIRLRDGQPVTDFANTSLSNLYRFQIPKLDESKSPSVEFSVVPQFGDPDMYISLNSSVVSKSNNDYHSNSASGPEKIVVHWNDDKYKKKCGNSGSCEALIRVYGFEATKYNIVARVASSAMRLADGVAVNDDVEHAKYNHYIFVVDSSNSTVRIVVTPFSGDPDLYVRTNADGDWFPTADNSTWSSSGINMEAVTLFPSDFEDCFAHQSRCTFLISVLGFSYSTSSYSIQASTEVPQLVSGEPQTGTVGAAMFSYYRFRLPSDADDDDAHVIISLARTSGSTELYITNRLRDDDTNVFPKISSDNEVVDYLWSTSGDDSVRIYRTDTKPQNAWTPGRDYIVGVLGSPFRFQSDYVVTYVYSTNSTIRRLQDGVSITDDVNQGRYTYYKIEVPNKNSYLFIRVVPFFGDPDLYVSITNTNTHPTKDHNDFSSVSSLNDTLFLSKKDLEPCHGSTNCVVYIGVYGFKDSRYSLLATTNESSPLTLYEGEPQTARVPEGSYAYFVANLEFTDRPTYNIFVTPTSGDPDLYVNTITAGFPSKRFGDHDFASTTFGEENVEVNPRDHRYSKKAARIAVYAYSGPAVFRIQWVSSREVQTLQDGVPAQGELQGGSNEYSYFRFAMPPNCRSEDLVISLSPRNGDATFYVSTTVRYPTKENDKHTWSASRLSDNVLFISPDDANFTCSTNYYIGITSPTQDKTSFSIVVVRNNTLISLTDGSPQSNAVQRKHCRTFKMEVDKPTIRNLTISASPLTTSGGGDVRLAVTNDVDDNPTPENYPTLDKNYVWKSGESGSVDRHSLTILGNDSHVKPDLHVYLISVCAIDGDVLFSVSAVTSDTELILDAGTATGKLNVPENETFRFRFLMNNQSIHSQDLVLLLTTFSGKADIVLSRRSRPNCYIDGNDQRICQNATWGTESVSLRVQHDSPCSNALPTASCEPSHDWQPGWFNIGVLGRRDTSFSIIAYTRGIVTLREGEPQVLDADVHVPMYMSFGMSQDRIEKNRLPPLKFTIARMRPDGSIGVAGLPLIVYIQSCLENRCTQKQMHPSNEQYDDFFYVREASSSFYITSQELSLYCLPQEGNGCRYFLGAYVIHLGVNHDTNTTFQATAEVLGESSIATVPFDKVHNRLYRSGVYDLEGQDQQKFEVFLAPEVGSDPNLRIDSCGGEDLSLAVCDPSPSEGHWPCKDLYSPSPRNFTYENKTHAGGSGIATVRVKNHTTKFVVASVSSNHSDTFEFFVSTSPVWILEPSSMDISVSFSDSLEADVKWKQPEMVLYDKNWSRVRSEPAKNVTFDVYHKKGTFSVSTACGIEAQGNDPASVRGRTNVTLQNIDAHSTYQFAVVATCDESCWNATWANASPSAPGIINAKEKYSLQKVLFHMKTEETGASHSGSHSSHGLHKGAVAWIVIVCLVGVAGIIGLYVWRRKKRAAAGDQYDIFDNEYAMETKPRPAGGSSALLADEGGEFDDRLQQYLGDTDL